jgi:two-component system, cell cycle sensor histidine kinase and response regulator CckA
MTAEGAGDHGADADVRDARLARLEAIVESSGDGIIGATAEGIVTDWNPSAERIYGYSAAEIVGRPLKEVVPAEGGEAWEALVARLRAGERIERFETERVRKDGKRIRVSLSLAPLHDKTGTMVGFSAIVRDVTDLAEVEQQRIELEASRLRHSDRLETASRLAGGIAHDFNNILTAVLGFARLLLEELPDGHPQRSMVKEIETAAERAAELVRQLMAIGRGQVRRTEVLHLGEVVQGLQPMLQPLVGDAIDIGISIASSADLWRVEADRSQVERVIVNLVVNARDAMSGGGALTLELANTSIGPDEPRSPMAPAPGPFVMLAVRDTGPGLDPETRAHMFEPFFTTKKTGRGTGLGLATVLSIMNQSGGEITVESEVGQGTTMRLYFPRTSRTAEPMAAGVAGASPVTGGDTILVAEDEESVRLLVEIILRRLGYSVLLAADVGQALQMARGNDFDLLLTDVVMPDGSGINLAARLRNERPDIGVLFMSGYVAEDVLPHGRLAADELLEKPFTPAALAEAVRAALARAR